MLCILNLHNVVCQLYLNLKNNLEKEGIKLYIISNNTGDRVSQYANSLGVEYLNSTRKPFSYKLKRFILEKGFINDECLLVGDQLVTDVPCGLGAGIRVMLTDPIVDRDQWTTRFNRLLDKPKRKRLINKGLIKHLTEEDYGK